MLIIIKQIITQSYTELHREDTELHGEFMRHCRFVYNANKLLIYKDRVRSSEFIPALIILLQPIKKY